MSIEQILSRYTLEVDKGTGAIVGMHVVSPPRFLADQFTIRPLSRWERFMRQFRRG